MQSDTPLIVGIGGSTSARSSTNLLLANCLAHAAARGARTIEVSGPALATLPIYDAAADAHGEVAEHLAEAVRGADGVVIATPGYHGGMSGLVKNALDHLEALRTDTRPYLDGRPVGVIVSAAGWQACGTTLGSVRATIHALRGWPTPLGVTVNTAEQRPDAHGRYDDTVEGALDVLAGQLLHFTHLARS